MESRRLPFGRAGARPYALGALHITADNSGRVHDPNGRRSRLPSAAPLPRLAPSILAGADCIAVLPWLFAARGVSCSRCVIPSIHCLALSSGNCICNDAVPPLSVGSYVARSAPETQVRNMQKLRLSPLQEPSRGLSRARVCPLPAHNSSCQTPAKPVNSRPSKLSR